MKINPNTAMMPAIRSRASEIRKKIYRKSWVEFQRRRPQVPFFFFFLIILVGAGVQLGPLGTAATDWPIVACPG
jgi:hypothetical protein